MIFAIYKWLSESPDVGDGNFTNNKLYLAEASVDGGAVDLDNLRLKDDNGKRVTIHPDNGRFEYPEEVYGIIVKTLGSQTPGEVVVINDAQDDVVSIKDVGFVKSENVQLLDLTLVHPGIMVYDRTDSRWKEVKRVDGRMRMQVEDEMRECTDFVFATSDGELAIIPLVKCLNDEAGFDNLTRGSLYQIKGLDENGQLIIDDDNGDEAGFSSERFEFV